VDAIGEAITLVNPKDMHRFRRIEQLIETTLNKQQPPEELGKGPQWSTGRRPDQKNRKYYHKKRNFSRGKPRGGSK
jgi:superfamily II DNA/RNA helicase